MSTGCLCHVIKLIVQHSIYEQPGLFAFPRSRFHSRYRFIPVIVFLFLFYSRYRFIPVTVFSCSLFHSRLSFFLVSLTGPRRKRDRDKDGTDREIAIPFFPVPGSRPVFLRPIPSRPVPSRKDVPGRALLICLYSGPSFYPFYILS